MDGLARNAIWADTLKLAMVVADSQRCDTHKFEKRSFESDYGAC